MMSIWGKGTGRTGTAVWITSLGYVSAEGNIVRVERQRRHLVKCRWLDAWPAASGATGLRKAPCYLSHHNVSESLWSGAEGGTASQTDVNNGREEEGGTPLNGFAARHRRRRVAGSTISCWRVSASLNMAEGDTSVCGTWKIPSPLVCSYREKKIRRPVCIKADIHITLHYITLELFIVA